MGGGFILIWFYLKFTLTRRIYRYQGLGLERDFFGGTIQSRELCNVFFSHMQIPLKPNTEHELTSFLCWVAEMMLRGRP